MNSIINEQIFTHLKNFMQSQRMIFKQKVNLLTFIDSCTWSSITPFVCTYPERTYHMYGPWPQSWSPYCIDISIVSPDQFCSTTLCQNLLEQKLNKSSWVKSCLVPSTSSLPIFSKHRWLINFLFEDQLLYFSFDKFVFVCKANSKVFDTF